MKEKQQGALHHLSSKVLFIYLFFLISFSIFSALFGILVPYVTADKVHDFRWNKVEFIPVLNRLG